MCLCEQSGHLTFFLFWVEKEGKVSSACDVDEAIVSIFFQLFFYHLCLLVLKVLSSVVGSSSFFFPAFSPPFCLLADWILVMDGSWGASASHAPFQLPTDSGNISVLVWPVHFHSPSNWLFLFGFCLAMSISFFFLGFFPDSSSSFFFSLVPIRRNRVSSNPTLSIVFTFVYPAAVHSNVIRLYLFFFIFFGIVTFTYFFPPQLQHGSVLRGLRDLGTKK